MPRVLVTGAAGFIGRATTAAFAAAGWDVRALVRAPGGAPTSTDERVVGDLTSAALTPHMAGVDCVVHLAARAHRMSDRGGARTEALYRAANVDATLAVARAAIEGRVRRFVFVSTAKVFGEGRDRPYTERDVPEPADAYARTKLEAELQLKAVAGRNMEVVVVRPPMVYGPGGKGNVPRLVQLARISGRIPLPFAGVQNRRSLLFVANLASALVHCATARGVTERPCLVSDGTDVSIEELLRKLAAHAGVRARLFAVPPLLLRLAGSDERVRRLTGSFTLDAGRFLETGWAPPFTLDEGLRATVNAEAALPTRAAQRGSPTSGSR